jgi:putative peptide zinc metalloprotease protein
MIKEIVVMIIGDTPSKLRTDLIIHTSSDTPERFLLEDPESNRAFTFKKREFTIITLLDGVSSLNVITKNASLETGANLSVATVIKFVERLSQLGLLEQNNEQKPISSLSRPQKGDYIEIKLEPWSRLLHFIAMLVFSSLSGSLLFILIIGAFIAEIVVWHDIYAQDIQRYFSWPTMVLTFFFIYACLPIILIVHEMGHLIAALRFLQRLYPIRIYRPLKAYVSLPPAAVWSLHRRTPRVVMALAGLYFQALLLLCVWAIWGYMGRQAVIGLVCTAFSIPLIGGFLLSVIPVYPGLPERKTDGYFALSYLLNIPNLAARAQAYLRWKKDNTQKIPVWFTKLTRFQHTGLMWYVSLLPWLGLALIVTVFCSVSFWVFLPIHTTGVVVVIIIAFWLIWPYLTLLKQGIVSILKLLRKQHTQAID